MLKISLILLVVYFAHSQSFRCEFKCPENSKCSGENKCTCFYGYKQVISDFNGLPYCQWQGTTSTQRSPVLVYPIESTVKPKIQKTKEDDLVDDNGELFGDYRYQREQQEQEQKKIFLGEQIKNNIKSKLLSENMPTIAETTSEKLLETTVNEEGTPTTIQKKLSIFPLKKLEKPNYSSQEQNGGQDSRFKKLLFKNVHSNVENSNKHQLSSEEETTTLINPTSTTFELSTMETTTTMSTLRKGSEISTFSPTQIIKVVKHVEQPINKGSTVLTFYNSLGVLCTFLAFAFATTVVFDCVKL